MQDLRRKFRTVRKFPSEKPAANGGQTKKLSGEMLNFAVPEECLALGKKGAGASAPTTLPMSFDMTILQEIRFIGQIGMALRKLIIIAK